MKIEHHMVDPYGADVPPEGCDLVCRAGCGSVKLTSDSADERLKAKMALDRLAPSQYGLKVFHVG